jgi:hypothetical protein
MMGLGITQIPYQPVFVIAFKDTPEVELIPATARARMKQDIPVCGRTAWKLPLTPAFGAGFSALMIHGSPPRGKRGLFRTINRVIRETSASVRAWSAPKPISRALPSNI